MIIQFEALLRQWPWLQTVEMSRTVLTLLAIAAFVLLWNLLRLFRGRHKWRKALRGIAGSGLFIFICLAFLIIKGYSRHFELTFAEREIALISFADSAEKGHTVRITEIDVARPAGKEIGNWHIRGAEWRITAMLFAFTNWRGETAYYYRYQYMIARRAEQEGVSQHAFRIQPDINPDFWHFTRRHLQWLPGMKAYKIESEAHPIKTGQQYRLVLTPDSIAVKVADAP